MNRRIKLGLLTTVVAAAAVVPASASATVEAGFLDSYSSAAPSPTGAAGPWTTFGKLAAGKDYVVQVTGTYSRYTSTYWKNPPTGFSVCGHPEPFPMFPSLGRPLAPVGADAETFFGRVDIVPDCAGPLEQIGPNTTFQVDLGSGYSHPVAVGAPYSTPRLLHSYTYVVTGQGQRASFRIADGNTRDNYGQLQITVVPKLL